MVGSATLAIDAVDHRHHQAERDREDRPVALRLGQAVGVFDRGRSHYG